MERYFDSAATYPTKPQVLNLYKSLSLQYWGNPASSHKSGTQAEELLKKAKDNLALLLSSKPDNIFFTSGATESNSIVLQNLLIEKARGREVKVLISDLEHPSILSFKKTLKLFNIPCFELRAKNGFVDIDDYKSLLENESITHIFILHIDSLTGNIMPLEDLLKIKKEIEIKNKRVIYFHSDMTQSIGKIPVDLGKLENLGLTSSSFSFHKIGGIIGSGFLFLSRNIEVLNEAGGQESGVRGGTQNAPLVFANVEALKMSIESIKKDNVFYSSLREKVIDILKEKLGDNFKELGIGKDRIGSILPIVLKSAAPQVITRSASDMGFMFSFSSACSEKKSSQNAYLKRGYSSKDSQSVLRISFCEYNTLESAGLLAECIGNLYLKYI